jgi:ribosomal protein S20
VKYDKSKTLRDKILYVLSVMKKASPQEVAAEIMELDEISTEDGIDDISIDIEKEIDKMYEKGIVNKIKEQRQKSRYTLNTN